MATFSPFETSLWYATAQPAPVLPPLRGDTSADVCVVGGGDQTTDAEGDEE